MKIFKTILSLWFSFFVVFSCFGEVDLLKTRKGAGKFYREIIDKKIKPGTQVKMLFLNEKLSFQKAIKFRHNSTWERFLYVKDRFGYNTEEKSLGMTFIIFELCYDKPHSTEKFKTYLGFTAYINVSPEEASGIACGMQDNSISVEFCGVVASNNLSEEDNGDDKSFFIGWEKVNLTFSRFGKKLFTKSAQKIKNSLKLDIKYLPVKKKKKLIRKTVFKSEAEDLDGLCFYADWERDEPGWYAREMKYRSGKGIAAVHQKNMGAEIIHQFNKPLPPGTYQLFLTFKKPTAYWDESELEITFGDAKDKITWVRVVDDNTCPPFKVTKPVKEFKIKAVKCNAGGVNTVPELVEPVIVFDNMRIDKIDWEENLLNEDILE